jgi:hypothetical protein
MAGAISQAEKKLQEAYEKLDQQEIDFVAKVHPNAAKGMQLAHDNPDKAIYLDTRNGSEITVLDGDKETIKPYLANRYEQSLAKTGGVEALIEQRTIGMKNSGVPQAVMDKEVELMRAAEGDGQKYANLRFENNSFFAEQEKAAGKDPAAANDIRITTITTIEENKIVNGKVVEGKPEEPSPKLQYDKKAMVLLHENGKITPIGASAMLMDRSSGYNGMHEITNEFFNKGLEKHGSVEAFAEYIKKNDLSDTALGTDPSPEVRQRLVESIQQSEGKAEYFSAAMFKSINAARPDNEVPSEQTLEQKNTKDTLLMSAEKADAGGFQGLFNGNMDINQFFEQIMAFFKSMSSGNMSVAQAAEQFGNKLGIKEDLVAKTEKSEKLEKLEKLENKEEVAKGKDQEEFKDTYKGKPLVWDKDGIYTLEYDKNGKAIAVPLTKEEAAEVAGKGEATPEKEEVAATEKNQEPAQSGLMYTADWTRPQSEEGLRLDPSDYSLTGQDGKDMTGHFSAAAHGDERLVSEEFSEYAKKMEAKLVASETKATADDYDSAEQKLVGMNA